MIKSGLLPVLALLAPGAALAQAAYTPPETVIQDNISYHVHWDGTYDYEEAVTLRLNTGQAVQDDGHADIYYDGSKDQVTLLSAYTMTPAGRRLDVLPGNILDQADTGDGDSDSYSDGGRKVILFPNLTPGATLHYHYIIKANGTYFPGQFFTEENFPVDNATQAAAVTVTAPAALKLYFQAVDMQGGQVTAANPAQQKWVYTLHDVAAVPPEKGSVAVSDFSPRLDVTSFADYAAVAAAYEQNAAGKSAVTPAVQQLADEITQGITAPRGQAQALYNWVSRNIRYVAIDLGYNGYTPHSADDTITSGYGDCKDHVALLIALLAAKHIPASGVLVNWNDAFFTPSVAMPLFNHIITYIPQFNLYLDSTAQFAPFGVLPAFERGKQALITGAPGIAAQLVTLPVMQGSPDVADAVTHETLAADGTLTGTTLVRNSGRYEIEDREIFDELDPGTAAATATLALEDYGQLGSGDYSSSTTDPRDLAQAFVYGSQFSLPAYATLPGPGTMPIAIGVPVMLALYPRHTALPSITHPVPCLPQDLRQTIFLRLPPHVTPRALPAQVDYTGPLGSYTARYRLAGGEVQVTRHLVTHPAGPTCTPGEYEQLRQLSFALERDFRAVISY